MYYNNWNEVRSMCKCLGYQHEVLGELDRRLLRGLCVPAAFLRMVPELGLPAVRRDFIRVNTELFRVLELAPPPPQLALLLVQRLDGEDHDTYRARMMEQMHAMQEEIYNFAHDVRQLRNTVCDLRGLRNRRTSGSGGPRCECRRPHISQQ
jgi:hypothetical protein